MSILEFLLTTAVMTPPAAGNAEKRKVQRVLMPIALWVRIGQSHKGHTDPFVVRLSELGRTSTENCVSASLWSSPLDSNCLDHLELVQIVGQNTLAGVLPLNTLKTPSPPSIDRALGLLELVAQSHHGLTLAEAAERMAIPRSSAHTILLSLERREWLRRSGRTHRYLFGPKLFSLANRALGGTSMREAAAPALKALLQETGLSVHMAILEEDQAVLVEQYAPPHTRLQTWVGKRMELHCTALGKVLLAWLPEDDLRRVLNERALPRHNENTKSSPRRLHEELRETRKRGYAVDDEVAEIGFRCLGAPVFDGAGEVVAAISVSGSTAQLHFVNAAPIAAQLCETAQAISKAMAQGEG